MTYTDAQIKELHEFAEAVILCLNEKAVNYAQGWPDAYRQYYVEVVLGISGMQDNPRLFFESDLALRKLWGDHIARDYEQYKAAVTEAERQPTAEPESVKALREALEKMAADLEKVKQALAAPPAPAAPAVPAEEPAGPAKEG
jgi:hypothetical protein